MTPVDREEDEDAELLPRLALTGLLSLGCLVVEVEADVEAAVITLGGGAAGNVLDDDLALLG